MAGVAAVSPKFYFPGAEGGTVDVYIAGTTSRTNTWQDRAQTTLNENPVELDARGECVLWLSDALRYKFVPKNAAGVALYTIDNVAGAEAADATVSQFTVDRFSGDGSDTTFTLSVTPDSENAVDVYISGVYQQKNTYSVAGTTLTFDTAPASGTNNVEVVTTSILDYTTVAAEIAVSLAAAAASASAAATSATNAATSATNAANSATNAATSEGLAAASAASAAAVSGSYVGLTRSAIKALDTATVQLAHLKDGYGSGQYEWDSSDLSASIVNRTQTSSSVSSAGDSVTTATAHGLGLGDAITVDTAINGLSANTIYWTIYSSATTFKLATSYANAVAGTAVDITGTTNFTFSVLNDAFEVVYITPNGISQTGSAGAWKRVVTDNEYHCVWWGLSSGQTNAQRQINAAARVIPTGCTLVLPPFEVIVSKAQADQTPTSAGIIDAIQIRKSMHVRGHGYGTYINGNGAALNCLAVNASNVTVSYARLGNVEGQLTLNEAAGIRVSPSFLQASGVGADVENVHIDHCWVDTADTGVTFVGDFDLTSVPRKAWWSKKGSVTNCRLLNIRRQGVEMFQGSEFHITGNTMTQADKGVYAICRCIRVIGSDQLVISNNLFYGYSQSGVEYVGVQCEISGFYGDPDFYDTTGNVLVQNNQFFGFRNGLFVNQAFGSLRIVGNNFHNTQDGSSNYALRVSSLDWEDPLDHPGSNKVESGLIEFRQNTVMNFAKCVKVEGCIETMIVEGNNFVGNTATDTGLLDYAQNAVAEERLYKLFVRGNVSITNPSASASGVVRITALKSADEVYFDDNYITPDSSGAILTHDSSGLIYVQSPVSNTSLPVGLWASNLNPPRGPLWAGNP